MSNRDEDTGKIGESGGENPTPPANQNEAAIEDRIEDVLIDAKVAKILAGIKKQLETIVAGAAEGQDVSGVQGTLDYINEREGQGKTPAEILKSAVKEKEIVPSEKLVASLRKNKVLTDGDMIEMQTAAMAPPGNTSIYKSGPRDLIESMLMEIQAELALEIEVSGDNVRPQTQAIFEQIQVMAGKGKSPAQILLSLIEQGVVPAPPDFVDAVKHVAEEDAQIAAAPPRRSGMGGRPGGMGGMMGFPGMAGPPPPVATKMLNDMSSKLPPGDDSLEMIKDLKEEGFSDAEIVISLYKSGAGVINLKMLHKAALKEVKEEAKESMAKRHEALMESLAGSTSSTNIKEDREKWGDVYRQGVIDFCEKYELPYVTEESFRKVIADPETFTAIYSRLPTAKAQETALKEKNPGVMLVIEPPSRSGNHGHVVSTISQISADNVFDHGKEGRIFGKVHPLVFIQSAIYSLLRQNLGGDDHNVAMTDLIKDPLVVTINNSTGWPNFKLGFGSEVAKDERKELEQSRAFFVHAAGNSGWKEPMQQHNSEYHRPGLVVHVAAAAPEREKIHSIKDFIEDRINGTDKTAKKIVRNRPYHIEAYSSVNSPMFSAPVKPDAKFIISRSMMGEEIIMAMKGTSFSAPWVNGALKALDGEFGKYLTREQILFSVVATTTRLDSAKSAGHMENEHELEQMKNAQGHGFNPTQGGFGLINVDKAAVLCEHMVAYAQRHPEKITKYQTVEKEVMMIEEDEQVSHGRTVSKDNQQKHFYDIEDEKNVDVDGSQADLFESPPIPEHDYFEYKLKLGEGTTFKTTLDILFDQEETRPVFLRGRLPQPDEKGTYVYSGPPPQVDEEGVFLSDEDAFGAAKMFADAAEAKIVTLTSPSGTEVRMSISFQPIMEPVDRDPQTGQYIADIVGYKPYSLTTTPYFMGEDLEGEWTIKSNVPIRGLEISGHAVGKEDMISMTKEKVNELLNLPRPDDLGDAKTKAELNLPWSDEIEPQESIITALRAANDGSVPPPPAEELGRWVSELSAERDIAEYLDSQKDGEGQGRR